ncbi:hypothetical protein NG895_25570 [Aeoliella sp. ICT_H6.2]|uniref:Peptidase MA superfamily protein n=1 Tax=Aeoliella straminimaris TaxID=2954799 RepID=A0A9X2FHY8_9BACT|nr:hypothetical protein [Aeoliella straminimaris]MCO6047284.1 hypothetical protein [Aeoliella straminimaris]
MEARTKLSAALPVVFAAIVFGLLASVADAARYTTTNFVVNAPTPQLAKEIGEMAEHWRRELSIEWIGKEMPAWSRPCPIKADVAPQLGAGGVTTFVFDRGEVFDWNMTITGSRERVLDSVLPHEITHTIFACHFRQPLPRWADEGACTTVEHRSEIAKQEHLLIRFLKTGKGIPFRQMFDMKEYPPEVLPLYAQGHSLTRYLIGQRGKAAFLEFLADGMSDENWPRAVKEHYGQDNLFALQNQWLDWVKQGRPILPGESAGGENMLASNQPPATPTPPSTNLTPASSTNYESAYSKVAGQHNGTVVRRPAGEGSHYSDAPPANREKKTYWR